MRTLRSLLLAWIASSCCLATTAFVVVGPSSSSSTSQQTDCIKNNGRPLSSLSMAAKTTLTEETDWNLRIVLRGVTTEQGRKVDEIFRVQCQFVEEEGYEPPQGTVIQQSSSSLLNKPQDNDDDAPRFQLTKSRWILSEDPNDRKDGLWVWGLFAEPLYPFMLLQLETAAIPLPSNNNNDDTGEEKKPDSIPPLQLYAQINHRRDKEKGVVLEAATLKIREMETVRADILGVAKVDVYDEVNIGTLSIQPAVVTNGVM